MNKSWIPLVSQARQQRPNSFAGLPSSTFFLAKLPLNLTAHITSPLHKLILAAYLIHQRRAR
jgi:hypothetical protein